MFWSRGIISLWNITWKGKHVTVPVVKKSSGVRPAAMSHLSQSMVSQFLMRMAGFSRKSSSSPSTCKNTNTSFKSCKQQSFFLSKSRKKSKRMWYTAQTPLIQINLGSTLVQLPKGSKVSEFADQIFSRQ